MQRNMRAIIRFSLNGKQASPLRQKIGKRLADAGFHKRKNNTATWEHPGINALDLKAALFGIWHEVEHYTGDARVDHFWMYVDE